MGRKLRKASSIATLECFREVLKEQEGNDCGGKYKIEIRIRGKHVSQPLQFLMDCIEAILSPFLGDKKEELKDEVLFTCSKCGWEHQLSSLEMEEFVAQGFTKLKVECLMSHGNQREGEKESSRIISASNSTRQDSSLIKLDLFEGYSPKSSFSLKVESIAPEMLLSSVGVEKTSKNKVQVMETLGEGAFAKVYKAQAFLTSSLTSSKSKDNIFSSLVTNSPHFRREEGNEEEEKEEEEKMDHFSEEEEEDDEADDDFSRRKVFPQIVALKVLNSEVSSSVWKAFRREIVLLS